MKKIKDFKFDKDYADALQSEDIEDIKATAEIKIAKIEDTRYFCERLIVEEIKWVENDLIKIKKKILAIKEISKGQHKVQYNQELQSLLREQKNKELKYRDFLKISNKRKYFLQEVLMEKKKEQEVILQKAKEITKVPTKSKSTLNQENKPTYFG
ncbi:MAG: hypothetical protein QF917_04695 [Candidatus Woesearchaeota archaeon]|nr:hypothetical protein [Candidatus Woesearchaeota archaeon]